MPEIKHIGGIGCLKVEIVGVGSVIFSTEEVKTKVKGKEDALKIKDLNGLGHKWSRGQDYTITCTIYNALEDAYTRFQTLGNYINLSNATDATYLRIYPKYNAAAESSEYYDCKYESGWDFEELFEMLELGQKVEVVFETAVPKAGVSTYVDTIEN